MKQFPAKHMLMVLALVLVEGLSQGAKSQSPAAVEKKSPMPIAQAGPVEEETETTQQADDAAHQGIKIHGHWVIDVKNADGSIASHRDFHNSLVDNGLALSYLLAGRWTSGEWVIELDPPNSGSSVCGAATSACYLMQYANGNFAKFGSPAFCSYSVRLCTTGTVVAVAANSVNGSNRYSLVLSAQYAAASTGTIGQVATSIFNCTTYGTTYSNVTPADCGPHAWPSNTTYGVDPVLNGVPQFTRATLAPGIAVTQGQTVVVTVTLSFS